MSRLKNKVAIVTGASTKNGIGRAVALRLAHSGASLFLVADRTEDQLEDAVAECRAVDGCGAAYSALLDLGLPGAPEEMVEMARTKFGRVDILINNAGLRAPFDFGEFERETFERMISVNVGAVFFASQAVLPLMRKQGGGRIINVASQLAYVTAPQRALYGMTKAALIYLTKAMAVELCEENIIVNSVSPGPVATDPLSDMKIGSMRENFDIQTSMKSADIAASAPWNSDMVAKVPLGRLASVKEIAEVIYFLSDAAPSFLIGHDVIVDGGYVLK